MKFLCNEGENIKLSKDAVAPQKTSAKVINPSKERAKYEYELQQQIEEVELNVKEKEEEVLRLASEVIEGKWGNGSEREARLKKEGYDYDEIQNKVNEILSGEAKKVDTSSNNETTSSSNVELNYVNSNKAASAIEISASEFLWRGVVNYGDYKFTYYSETILPGGGLSIPGRHLNENGYVCDEDGYICLAGEYPMGTVFDTPFGAQGKIYDRGTTGNKLDVYLNSDYINNNF